MWLAESDDSNSTRVSGVTCIDVLTDSPDPRQYLLGAVMERVAITSDNGQVRVKSVSKPDINVLVSVYTKADLSKM